MNALDRRSALRLLAGTGLALTAAACAGPGGGPDAPRAADPSSGPATSGPVKGTVSFAHWRAEDKAVLARLTAAFSRLHPGTDVRQDVTPSADYQSTALRRIRGARSGDLFTAFRGAQFQQLVKAGVYAPLTGTPVLRRYQDALTAPGAQGGVQYGLPYQLVFNTPLANTDALDRAGHTAAPRDWDGFLQLLDDLKAKGYTPLAWPGGDAANAGQLLNTMVMNNLPEPDAFAGIETGRHRVTDDWFLTTLRQYAQLRPYLQPRAAASDADATLRLFAQGRAGLLATGSFQTAAARALGARFPVDLVAPITTAAGRARYEGVFNATFILGVNNASSVQPAAYALLEFLSEPRNAAAYADGTGQHVTVAGVEYTNPDLKALAPWLTRRTLLAPRFQFLDLDIRSAVENATVAVVRGTDPHQAAEEAQRVIDQKRA
ncbi:extracellular solute-binding protein [Streptacidiphilus sp. ASG 303]|uniref:ABC transporter substrate-binding protein n=1 Tax=Streptacidiphilus sp. ASG 303 TaxID=2896847 RepID=UPI001E5BDD80|nr:extracellular solute-binding protein [Streptacidiphilus sp. ASG 303]MCD0485505.1 extracellular solute-binding protein [Streptacidiphilus sp. ASG 303]